MTISDYFGENGACNEKYPEHYIDMAHHQTYQVGETNLIPVSHFYYFTTLVRNQILRETKGSCRYEDQYENDKLMFHPGFRMFKLNNDSTILNKTREYFSHHKFIKS